MTLDGVVRVGRGWQAYRADCMEVLVQLEPASVDAIVTDPPAGIGFMGKEWDRFDAPGITQGLHQGATDRAHAHGIQGVLDAQGPIVARRNFVAFMTNVMRECLRVLKPGGHALIWALPRTSHWTATAVEDAGFEIRDVVMHLFGTGFPKSLDVSKAIDKAAGAERERGPVDPARAGRLVNQQGTYKPEVGWSAGSRSITIDPPATATARQWSGWGTALKPAAEHWILARKPLDGTVAANVLTHGTGALNIDATRIGYVSDADKASATPQGKVTSKTSGSIGATPDAGRKESRVEFARPEQKGRWPANVTLDEDAAAQLDAQSGVLSGGASRFFYVAKGSRREKTHGGTINNTHPTVKSLALMRWLIRLITPPGGTVLDPFMGSGTTGVAARAEGAWFLGVEREADYFSTATARLMHTDADAEDDEP